MDEKVCTTCHVLRPVADFNVRRSAPDGLQSRCRTCARAWYVVHRTQHAGKVQLRNKRVRAENQALLGKYLLEHPCVDCGEADVRVLDFDHEDPSQKTADVGRLATCRLPWARVAAEIEKCSVRCANCHRRRTALVRGYWRAGVERGRREMLLEQVTSRLATVLDVRST
jgi:hypothetical protein